MSELDEAMLKHIAHIVNSERSPFTYRDFLNFEVNEKPYKMKHGTFRNKVSKLIKTNKVEVSYYSGLGFYTLKGIKFGKLMTTDHTMVHNNPFYKLLLALPFHRQSIHDIRLRFEIPNIWNLFSTYTNFTKIRRSNDIRIPPWMEDNAIMMVTIHKTDVVSVTVSCSLFPIPLDVFGISNFFALLVRVEERLKNLLHNIPFVYHSKNYQYVPNYKNWIVTMWHFGRDGLTEYCGEKFCITVDNALGILTRIYSKDMKNEKRAIRIECQEYPKKPLEVAIREKIYGIAD